MSACAAGRTLTEPRHRCAACCWPAAWSARRRPRGACRWSWTRGPALPAPLLRLRTPARAAACAARRRRAARHVQPGRARSTAAARCSTGRRRPGRLAAAGRGAGAAPPADGDQRRAGHRQDDHRGQPAGLPAGAAARRPHRAGRAHRQGRRAHERGAAPARRAPAAGAARAAAGRGVDRAPAAGRAPRRQFRHDAGNPLPDRRAGGRRSLDARPGAGHAAAGGRARARPAWCCWATRTSWPRSNRARCSPSSAPTPASAATASTRWPRCARCRPRPSSPAAAPATARCATAVVWLTRNFRFAADSGIGRRGRAHPPGPRRRAAGLAAAARRRRRCAGSTTPAARRRPGHAGSGCTKASRRTSTPCGDDAGDVAAITRAFDRFRVLCAVRDGPRGVAGRSTSGCREQARGRVHRRAGGRAPGSPAGR